MAVKKALVVSSQGKIEELQSGDTLELPASQPGGGSFYTAINLFGSFTDVQFEQSTSLELVGTGRLNTASLPSGLTANLNLLCRKSAADITVRYVLDAILGVTTENIADETFLQTNNPAEWVSFDVSSNISSLTNANWELELFQQRVTTGTSSRCEIRKAVLVITG